MKDRGGHPAFGHGYHGGDYAWTVSFGHGSDGQVGVVSVLCGKENNKRTMKKIVISGNSLSEKKENVYLGFNSKGFSFSH